MKITKRAIGIILAVMVAFSNIPVSVFATGGESGGLTDAKIVSADHAWLTFDVIKNSGNADEKHIVNNLYLPANGKNGSNISWVSSDDTVIKTSAEEAGQVTRPSAADGDKNVTLTATLTKGTESATEDFTLMVIALESTDISLEKLHARQDYNWLTYSIILKDNKNNGTPPDVTTDLSLPEHGKNGSAISWMSSDKSVVLPDGSVIRPQQSMADSRNNSYLVTLTAKIVNGDCTLKKSMHVYVDCLYDEGDTGDVDMACGALTADRICGFNTQDCVLSNLTLPTKGLNGCSIRWASSDTSIVAEDGTVVQPAYSLTGYHNVTLTATVSKNDAKQTKQFTIRIFSTPSDEEKTAAQKDARWLTGDGELKTILNGNTDADMVTANLSLPTKGENGSAVSWNSSDPSVVATDGTVTRPVGYESRPAILTATVTNGEAQVKRKIILSVSPSDGASDEQDVEYDYGFLDEDSITYGDEDTDLNHLTTNLFLFNNDSGTNPSFNTGKGCAVSWNSSDLSVLEVVKENEEIYAVPHCPSFLEGDKTVTLTATITKGDASREKSFQITVVAQNPGGAEAIVLDKEWLTDDFILNGNSADDVKRTLNLPMKGKYGSQISWQSSSAAVDPGTGKVTRPKRNQSNVNVTLTANLSFYGDNGLEAKDSKIFQITVTEKENSYLAVRQNDFANTNNFSKNGDASIISGTDGKKVLHFEDRNDNTEGGSLFTKTKIHLNNDMSFSTSFDLKTSYTNTDAMNETGGIAFTLQTHGSDQYGTGKASLGIPNAAPVFSVGIVSRKVTFGSQPDGVFHENSRDAEALINGSVVDDRTYSLNLSSGADYTFWVDYNGKTKKVEIRYAKKGTVRPDNADITMDSVNLSTAFQTSDGQSIQDVYAGFTGGAGDEKDNSFDIWNWSLQNGSIPIDQQVYDYIDVSHVSLLTDGSVSQQSCNVEAIVQKSNGTPLTGIPVAFTSTYGNLSDSSAVTGSDGKASVTLNVKNAGLTTVEAVASGGACARVTYSFAFSDADSVALDAKWLQTKEEQKAILNKNSGADNVLTALFLPGTGLNGSKITWKSNNTAVTVDGTTGKIKLPTAEQGDQSVTMTATISKGNESDLAVFSVTVKTTDTAYVLADYNDLTDSKLLNGNSDLAHVTKDLTLPVQGKNGSTITWSSSDFQMINDKTGKISPAPFTIGAKTVTLTATLILSSITKRKKFEVTVLPLAPTDQEAVIADAAALTESSILNGNVSADSITGSLSLRASGANGSTIKWTSSNPLILAVDGTVNRPSYSTGDQSITLTATLTKGKASAQKKLSLTIKRMDPTNEELLLEGRDWLNESRTLGPDNLSQYAVTSDLKLPEKTANGLSITWKSGTLNVISDNGIVTRPAVGAKDQPVTLTATITDSSGYITKELHYTVLKEPDIAPPRVVSSSPESGSTGVAFNTTKITLTFDEAVKLTNGSAKAGFSLKGPDTPDFYVMGGSSGSDEKTLTVTVPRGLASGSTYTLTVPNGTVTDLSGNSTESDYTLTFTLEKKVTKTIGIVSTSPTDQQTDYAGGSTFTVTFDTSGLEKGAAFDKISVSDRDWGKYSLIESLSGSTLTLTLGNGNQVVPSHVYEIFIPAGAVRDRFGNANAEKTIRFCSRGSVFPTVSSYPADGLKSVDIHQDIFLRFSGDVFLETSGVTLKDSGGNVVEMSVGRFGSGRDSYVVQPVKPLRPNTSYTLRIVNTAAFMGDNRHCMVSDYSMSFTTGGNALPVQSTSPVALEQSADVGGTVTIRFSSDVKKAGNTSKISIIDKFGNESNCSATVNGETVTVKTDYPFTDDTAYIVTLPAGAYESAGGKNDALRFRFVTAKAIDSDFCTFKVTPSYVQLTSEPISFSINEIQNELKRSGYTLASIKWDFGDGGTSQEESPSHVYAASGRYPVTLSVADDKGHAYRWERGVDILSYSAGQIRISVSPNTNTACNLTDKATLKDYKSFIIHLTFGNSSAKMPLCGKTVRAQLYQNGKLVKNLSPDSAVTGDGSHVYEDGDGHYQNNRGVAVFPFWYQYYLPGTYELRFIYGTEDDNVSVSVPITIYNKRTSQDLKLHLYNSKTGDLIYFPGVLYFLLDGKKVEGYGYYKSSSDFGVLIQDVALGEHSLEFVSAEPSGEFTKFTYIINPFTVNHTGESNCQSVKMIPKQPGVISVTSGSSDSSSTKDAVFIYDADGPTLTITVKGDWDGMKNGTYILKTSGGRILNTYDTRYTRGNPDTIRFYNFYPQAELPVGERLLVGMVTPDGRQSSWVDCKIKTIALPELSSDSEIVYENGQYTIRNTVTIPAVTGNASGDPDLDESSVGDSIPGLGGTSGYTDTEYKILGGKWDPERITMDKIRLTYDVNTGYTQSNTVKGLESVVMMQALGYSVNVDFSGEYLLNYNSSTNQWEVYYQAFSMTGDLQKKVYEKKIKIPKTSISVASLTVKLGVLVRNTLVFDYAKSDLPSGEILHVEPNAEGDVEVGWSGANVTASLGASLPFELDYPTGYFEINPNATFKVKAKFLFYSKTLYKKKVQAKWDNGKKKINLMALALAGGLPTSKDLEESPRDYLTRPFQWLSSALAPKLSLSKASVKSANPSVVTLAKNVYPDADVQLVQSNGKLYAVWTDDNPDRSDANRTQLRYSVYENGAWSAPAWLGSDTTGNFSPAAAAAGDGTLIAWQDMKKELASDTDADEASRNCEISVSKDPLTSDNSSSFEAVRMTNDDEFDHSPDIASDGTGAVVTWVKSDGLALDGTATHDSLWSARWTQDGGWSSAEKLVNVGHTVINSSLVMHGGKAVLLYTVDMDDKLSTSDDQEIYAMTWNGSSWGTPVRLTNNKVEDSSPQVTYANDGWLIVWNQDDQTVYRTGLNGKTKMADTVSGAGNKFQLVSTGGDNPQVTLVYYMPGDHGTRGLAESIYDATAGLWGNEKVLTDGTGGYTGSFCPVYTNDGELKIFYTQADMVTESIDGSDYNSASDKADLELLTYMPVHDLALDADDGLQLSTETLVAGVSESVMTTVENLGDYAENAVVSLYCGNPANGGVEVAHSKAITVAAHSSAHADISWQVASDFTGSHGLYAVVSPAEEITDSNESNNTISRPISTSDISISDAKGDYIVGNKYEVTAAIQNNGSDMLKNVVMNLTDDKSGKTLASETIDELDPGMTGGFDEIVSVDGLTKNSDGSYHVTLKAVLPADVTDNNTGDNTDPFELEVPFITVNSMTPASNETQVELQQPISVTFNMKVQKGSSFGGIRLTDSSLNPVKIMTKLMDDTLTVTPKGSMTKDMKYTLMIPDDAIVDAYGHKMEKVYTLTFTTATSSPAVVYTDPGEEAENALINSDIRLKYNQTVSQGSDFGGITVTDGNSKKVSVTASINGQWLTLHPGIGLSDATQYNVTVPVGAVKNGSGEVQEQTYEFSFTTESAEDASLSNLQTLVNTCAEMTQGNNTDASWTVFQTALSSAQTVLAESNPSASEIQTAIQSLTAAKNALTEKSGGTDGKSSNKSSNKNSGSVKAPSGKSETFRSDTTATYRFGRNIVYYYKITTSDTMVPTVISSNSQVATVRFAQRLPDGYLFRVTDIGEGTAVITTTSTGGTKTSFTVQGAAPQGIVSDTPLYHSMERGSTYQFKFTLTQGSPLPSFTTGNSRIVRSVLLRRDGNVYYFKILMLADGSAGIYLTMPGDSPVLRCVLSSSD